MAIRTVSWTVGEDMRVSPTATQRAGVQGDHLATCAEFTVPEKLRNGYLLQLEFISNSGEYDRSEALSLSADGKVSFLLPLAWTQEGGRATLRLVATGEDQGEGKEPETVYSTDGVLVFEAHQTGLAKVKSLISGAIAWLMERAQKAVERAEESVVETEAAVSKATAAKEYALASATAAEEVKEEVVNYSAASAENLHQTYLLKEESREQREAAEAAAERAEESAASVRNIDQSYRPESQNPQSGTAVAEAIASVEGKIPTVKVEDVQANGTSIVQDGVVNVESEIDYTTDCLNPVNGRAVMTWVNYAVPSVDDEYMPTSNNPQSGIAVAKAIAGVERRIPTVKVEDVQVNGTSIVQDGVANIIEECYELIEEITLTEATATVSRIVEPSGDEYKFKKIKVEYTLPSSMSRVRMQGRTNKTTMFNCYINATSTNGVMEVAVIDGHIKYYGMGGASSSFTSQICTTGAYTTCNTVEYLKSVILEGSSTFASGTIFRIFGVRT